MSCLAFDEAYRVARSTYPALELTFTEDDVTCAFAPQFYVEAPRVEVFKASSFRVVNAALVGLVRVRVEEFLQRDEALYRNVPKASRRHLKYLNAPYGPGQQELARISKEKYDAAQRVLRSKEDNARPKGAGSSGGPGRGAPSPFGGGAAAGGGDDGDGDDDDDGSEGDGGDDNGDDDNEEDEGEEGRDDEEVPETQSEEEPEAIDVEGFPAGCHWVPPVRPADWPACVEYLDDDGQMVTVSVPEARRVALEVQQGGPPGGVGTAVDVVDVVHQMALSTTLLGFARSPNSQGRWTTSSKTKRPPMWIWLAWRGGSRARGSSFAAALGA